MYRDDDAARDQRARALIDEIARLERDKLEAAAADRRIEEARRELTALQPAAQPAPRPPDLLTHAVVFSLAACATFLGYTFFF